MPIRSLALASLALLAAAPAQAARSTPPGDDFLAPYGLQNFSQHYRDALNTYLSAKAAYDADDLPLAESLLDALWAQYPAGDPVWWNLPWKPFGLNLGTPPCYYALRMLTDLVDWHLDHPLQPPAPRTATLTIVVVGKTSGIQPTTTEELNTGTGVPVTLTIDERLDDNDYAVFDESLDLFADYVEVITQGKLALDYQVLALPELDLPSTASASPLRYAGLVNASQVFDHVPEAVLASTDWWMVTYPSFVPEQYPDFTTTEFITGGMGLGPNASPMFIADEKWVLRKPPHLGSGEYSPTERSIYLPQWFQHEFFHHLYRQWPEFGLEDSGHQWFDRTTWPADFEGNFEPDYYHESLFKRIHDADPQPHVALRYGTAGAPFNTLTLDDVLSNYYRLPITNPWHPGRIELHNNQPRWRNNAGVAWSLTDNLAQGELTTGPDNPYAGNPSAAAFAISLQREPVYGDLTPRPRGFTFLNELYIHECALTDAQRAAVILSPDTPPTLNQPCPSDCPADLNHDGVLDNGDIGAFVTLFLTGDLAADFASDGILDNGDIGAFVTAFLAGC